MADLLSYEQSMRWYKLACAALLALPIWSFLALVPVTSRLTETEQAQFIFIECLVAGGLGLIALRMRESARAHATDELQLEGLLKTTARVGVHPISLTEMASALEGSDDLRTPASGHEPAPKGRRSDKALSTFRSDLTTVDNSDLAKRMQSDNSKLRSDANAPVRPEGN